VPILLPVDLLGDLLRRCRFTREAKIGESAEKFSVGGQRQTMETTGDGELLMRVEKLLPPLVCYPVLDRETGRALMVVSVLE
jgi:hypothetical protein